MSEKNTIDVQENLAVEAMCTASPEIDQASVDTITVPSEKLLVNSSENDQLPTNSQQTKNEETEKENKELIFDLGLENNEAGKGIHTDNKDKKQEQTNKARKLYKHDSKEEMKSSTIEEKRNEDKIESNIEDGLLNQLSVKVVLQAVEKENQGNIETQDGMPNLIEEVSSVMQQNQKTTSSHAKKKVKSKQGNAMINSLQTELADSDVENQKLIKEEQFRNNRTQVNLVENAVENNLTPLILTTNNNFVHDSNNEISEKKNEPERNILIETQNIENQTLDLFQLKAGNDNAFTPLIDEILEVHEEITNTDISRQDKIGNAEDKFKASTSTKYDGLVINEQQQNDGIEIVQPITMNPGKSSLTKQC
jgi:hypothetical protein